MAKRTMTMADLPALWSTSVDMRAELPVEANPKAEHRGFIETQQACSNKIAGLASDFLRASGYLASGRSKKKIPGL